MAAPQQSRERQQDSPKKNNSLRDFQGINTQAYRTSIGDNQFAWLENVMPIGFGNMNVPPGPSAAIASWTGTAYHMRSINLNGVTYEVIFTNEGAIFAVNLATFAVTTVAAAGTLSGRDSEICQWEDTIAVIIDATGGYFTWDGTTFHKLNGTVESLTITAIGTGYTTVPTIGGFASGGGAGGTATCHIQVGLAVLAVGGAGYVVGDVLTLAGGTFTTAAQVRVSAVAAGVVSGINLIRTGDYTVAPANPAATTGGYGAGATFNLNFGIGPITLTAPGSGYTSAPTITVTGGGGAGGAVTANLSAVPPGGTSCATYSGRVWVSSGRTVLFTAPGSYTDFTTASGGGSFIMEDETLVGDIVAVRSANNFLYIVGESSVNVVADVSVVNGITVFSNTNISASIGTPFENSVIAYYRSMWFANQYGIYALYGTTAQKLSDDLDGIFPFLLLDPDVESKEITAATAVIGQILCVCFLVQYADPVNGDRSIVFVFFNKKWFITSQRGDLVSIDTAIINGTPTMYGTDGKNLYRMFYDSGNVLPQTIVTKLWDMGYPLRDKQALKFGLEIVNPAAPQTITGTIDTERYSSGYPFDLSSSNYAIWINNISSVVTWSNAFGQTVPWIGSGYAFEAIDVEISGKYLGVTLNGHSAGSIYSALHLQYELRADW